MLKLPNTLVVLPYDLNWKTEFERIRDYLMDSDNPSSWAQLPNH